MPVSEKYSDADPFEDVVALYVQHPYLYVQNRKLLLKNEY